ncbi:MAG: C40 family peptidase [Gemmatimonadetes bacterium]|nr:C40 family peptidase [Gemmatimonadota bacterium]
MRAALALLLLGATPAAAQGPGFQIGHLFTDPAANSYRLGTAGRLTGPLGAALHATVVDGRAPLGNLWGIGVDFTLFRSGAAGVYVVGGVEGGLATRGDQELWGSWSTGLGYEVFPLRGLSLAAEGRYREVNGRYDGMELGVRLGLDRRSRGGGSSRPAPPAAAGPSTLATSAADAAPAPEVVRADLDRAGVTEEHGRLIGLVVQDALDVMGMPYRWGDEGEEGFDCSGLIQYAFGRHGIALPRRSTDQARQGTEVPRSLEGLRPGDVLTFANRGTRITHVGLYVGNGRFIHSARGGVQLSVLGPDDVSGRWWFRRWIGARRIIG